VKKYSLDIQASFTLGSLITHFFYKNYINRAEPYDYLYCDSCMKFGTWIYENPKL